VIEIEGISRFEVERILATFGSEPEAIFPAEDIHVRLFFTGGDRRSPDPSKAGPATPAARAGHHAALICRRDGHLGRSGRVGQQRDLGVLPQKSHVRIKLPCSEGCRARF
jgi:hypothetical protein